MDTKNGNSSNYILAVITRSHEIQQTTTTLNCHYIISVFIDIALYTLL